jgi:hypothetical protein
VRREAAGRACGTTLRGHGAAPARRGTGTAWARQVQRVREEMSHLLTWSRINATLLVLALDDYDHQVGPRTGIWQHAPDSRPRGRSTTCCNTVHHAVVGARRRRATAYDLQHTHGVQPQPPTSPGAPVSTAAPYRVVVAQVALAAAHEQLELPCHVGYRVTRDTMLRGIPCCVG